MREVSLDLLDIVQNSIDAGAKLIKADVIVDDKSICFCVRDDGKGMSDEGLNSALKGISSTGGTGIGLKTVSDNAKSADGTFEIKSKKGVGTSVKASYNHADVGDMGATYVALVDEGYDLSLNLKVFDKIKIYDTAEYKSALSVSQLQSLGVLREIREDINKFIRQNGGQRL